tara:strand:- start:88689 stop:89279 length:591 start_codon:yes stop_codon:yes gene_type:complete
MLTANQQFLKRAFDVSISIVLLVFIIIPLILLLLIASIDLQANGLFVQQRIGYLGKPFSLYKIRTLRGDDHFDVVSIHEKQTGFGRFLRRTKLDELPQLFNILKGDMSLVGPRPDVAGYADRLEGEDRIILSVKPGLTGPATLKYKNEDEILLSTPNPNKYNEEVIWPDKVAINKEYVLQWSFQKDLAYLAASVLK